MDLANAIDNGNWALYDKPFPFMHAQNVFKEGFYQSLASSCRKIVEQGLDEGVSRRRLSRNMAKYDAYSYRIDETYPELNGDLSIFITPEWSEMIGRIFGIQPTGYISCSMHYHTIGSDDGWIHTDFNPAWFPIKGDKPLQHTMAYCNYKTGAGPLAPDQKVEVVRAVAMIYYLCNDGWQEGMGGETGFFSSKKDPLPVIKVPPLNNSIVAYECTPRSYHTFLKNHVQERSSIIMWIHRTMDDAMRIGTKEQLAAWKA